MRHNFTLKAYHPLVSITIHFLKKLNVKITDTSVMDALQSHHDFPSLLSLSDTFSKWNIRSQPLRIDFNQLSEVPLPFIAHTNIENANFVIVEKISGNSFTIIKEDGLSYLLSKDDFNKIYSGVIIHTITGKHSGDPEYNKNIKQELIKKAKQFGLFAWIILLALLGLLQHKRELGIQNIAGLSIILFIKLCGIAATLALLSYEIDKSNPILKKICSQGSKVNCNSILQSKQSRFLSLFSWSEIGFYYFAGSYILLASDGYNIHFNSILNILAIPYTVYSVYFQWKIAKKWCTLCLLVQGLLLFEFLINIRFSFIGFPVFDVRLFHDMLISFAIPILLWQISKPLMLMIIKGKQYKVEMSLLKYDPTIFFMKLMKQSQILQEPKNIGITIGNPHGKVTITKVCNPYCEPCAKAHDHLEELAFLIPDLRIIIIFNATLQDDDARLFPTRHFLAIYEKGDQIQMHNALNDWYLSKNKDYNSFATKYPIDSDLKKQDTKIEAMNNWCEVQNIQFTPTLFVNGYQLPKNYTIDDLKYLIME